MYAILHNIRSAHNVGSMFRTADGAGVAKIYLTGYTPMPHTDHGSKTRSHPPFAQRFGRAQRDIEKTALGAETFVPWEYHKRAGPLIANLKNAGVQIVALEQTKKNFPYTSFKPNLPMCLIVGNEITGIPKSILKLCDKIIEIPMFGKKESLNVAVAFGIAIYHLIKRRLAI